MNELEKEVFIFAFNFDSNIRQFNQTLTLRVSDTFNTNEQQSNLGDRFTPDKQSCDPVISSLLPHTPRIYRNYRMFINKNNNILIFFHPSETI